MHQTVQSVLLTVVNDQLDLQRSRQPDSVNVTLLVAATCASNEKQSTVQYSSVNVCEYVHVSDGLPNTHRVSTSKR